MRRTYCEREKGVYDGPAAVLLNHCTAITTCAGSLAVTAGGLASLM